MPEAVPGAGFEGGVSGGVQTPVEDRRTREKGMAASLIERVLGDQ